MKRLLPLVLLAVVAASAWACPFCSQKDDKEGDVADNKPGLKQAVGLMMGIPYLMMGGFGAMIWIQYRRRRKQDDDYVSGSGPGSQEF